jgi:hypothetical protein
MSLNILLVVRGVRLTLLLPLAPALAPLLLPALLLLLLPAPCGLGVAPAGPDLAMTEPGGVV